MPHFPTSVVRVVLAIAALAPPAALPVASADTQLITNCPQPSESNGVILSDTVTDCGNSGNVAINASPEIPDYPYPWDDAFYGSALLIGGFGRGYR